MAVRGWVRRWMTTCVSYRSTPLSLPQPSSITINMAAASPFCSSSQEKNCFLWQSLTWNKREGNLRKRNLVWASPHITKPLELLLGHFYIICGHVYIINISVWFWKLILSILIYYRSQSCRNTSEFWVKCLSLVVWNIKTTIFIIFPHHSKLLN